MIPRDNEIRYKREVLSNQFREIHRAVKVTSSSIEIVFNLPNREPSGAIWADHPMLQENECLFSEFQITRSWNGCFP